MNKMKFSGSAVFGIILIAVGVVSLLSGLNYFDSWYIFSTYWPLIVVLFGLKSLVDHRSSTMFGLIVIAVGVFLQLDILGLWYLGDINVKELVVPVIIILIGLKFILPSGNKQNEVGAQTQTVVEEDKVQEVKIPKDEVQTPVPTEPVVVKLSDVSEEV